nr:MAG TPA: hypothetical protein [Caudoviricetes sp.]
MDFLTAKSEADGIVEQRKKLLKQMGTIIARTMQGRVINNRKRQDQVMKEFTDLLGGFTTEEQTQIMIYAFMELC